MDVANLEKCLICYGELHEKNKVKPDGCDHFFCIQCLRKWAKQEKCCPVDRIIFKKIILVDSGNEIKPKKGKKRKADVLYDFTTFCEACQYDDSKGKLLSCHSCNLSYHLQCLNPPLEKIPKKSWSCPDCVSISEKIEEKRAKNVGDHDQITDDPYQIENDPRVQRERAAILAFEKKCIEDLALASIVPEPEPIPPRSPSPPPLVRLIPSGLTLNDLKKLKIHPDGRITLDLPHLNFEDEA